MLVISQKKGEKIHIGRDITISILDVKANKVRIGIDAPDKLAIVRDEIIKDHPYTYLSTFNHRQSKRCAEKNATKVKDGAEKKE